MDRKLCLMLSAVSASVPTGRSDKSYRLAGKPCRVLGNLAESNRPQSEIVSKSLRELLGQICWKWMCIYLA